MNRHPFRRIPVALLVIAALLVTAVAGCGSAHKSVPTRKAVTLTLLGGRTENTTACDQTQAHPYHAYRLNTTLSMEGSLVPVPDGQWTVKIKFKQCNLGRFDTVSEVHVAGNNDGRFSYSQQLSAPGVFFARAYYYGDNAPLTSAEEYFRVTS